jgi:hypothetical protein
MPEVAQTAASFKGGGLSFGFERILLEKKELAPGESRG